MGCSSRYVPFGVGKVSSVLYVKGCSSRYVPFGVGKVSSVLYIWDAHQGMYLLGWVKCILYCT